MKIIRTNSANQQFKLLVKELDAYLKKIDGDEHSFYNQFNSINVLQHVVVLYQDTKPVGCGALKHFDEQKIEIKRMYVSPSYRNNGFAQKIIEELEQWASELGYKKCILETGKRQPEAVAFYTKNGYSTTKNYGQYKNVENSVCFEKII